MRQLNVRVLQGVSFAHFNMQVHRIKREGNSEIVVSLTDYQFSLSSLASVTVGIATCKLRICMYIGRSPGRNPSKHAAPD